MRRLVIGGLVVLVLLLLLGALAVVRVVGEGVQARKPLRTPASVGGLPRNDSPALRAAIDPQVRLLKERGAENIVVAGYGGGPLQPDLLLLGARARDRDREQFIEGFNESLGGRGGVRLEEGTGQEFERGGVTYRCAPANAGFPLALCLFDDGDVVGVGTGVDPGIGLGRLAELTDEGRRAMKG